MRDEVIFNLNKQDSLLGSWLINKTLVRFFRSLRIRSAGRKENLVRHFIKCAIIILFIAVPTSMSTAVFGQGIVGISPQAPAPYSMRQFGINLSTSDVEINNDDISVGSGDFPSKYMFWSTST